MTKDKDFIPSLKFHWLTRFYDPLVKRSVSIKRIKEALLLQANIKENNLVLDFGCGTATLTLMVKRQFPQAIVHGIDIDPEVLKIARGKVADSGYNIILKNYDGIKLPYENEEFHRVLSSFVFHHLDKRQKIRTLKEIHRVLKIGGQIHIADFGKAKNILMRGTFIPIQIFDGLASTTDNVKGLLPQIIQEAGFDKVNQCKQINTMFGTVALYKGVKYFSL